MAICKNCGHECDCEDNCECKDCNCKENPGIYWQDEELKPKKEEI